MEKADQDELIAIMTEQWEAGERSRSDILRAKMELETANSQLRSAIASERNAKYMLWSVIAAAISALASLGAACIAAWPVIKEWIK
jgi:outer membrane protein TolC